MIRSMKQSDLDPVALIWLDTNIKAHDFIPASYWRDHFEAVRGMLAEAEIYVWEEEGSGKVQGFVGLDGEYIAGIFVQSQSWSQGIGGRLLDYIKKQHSRLTLRVYAKNTRAVRFYQRESFRIQRRSSPMDISSSDREWMETDGTARLLGNPRTEF